MNEEPPEELAAVVKRNADIAVRKRLHKFCETILADTSGKKLHKTYHSISTNTLFSQVYLFSVIWTSNCQRL